MKKLTALLLALVFLTMALVACDGGSDTLDGKTFAYEKIEVDFESEEAEEFFNTLLSGGQSAADYFAKAMFGDEIKEMTFSFKDGKIFSSLMGGEENGIAYKLDGKEITFPDAGADEITEGVSFFYEGGKVVLAFETEVPTGLNETSSVALKILFKAK